MILYLQKNYNGTFAISCKNNYKDEIFNYDYETLIDNISKDTSFIDIYNLVVKNYNCKKLILDF